jgi:hypothetical protein
MHPCFPLLLTMGERLFPCPNLFDGRSKIVLDTLEKCPYIHSQKTARHTQGNEQMTYQKFNIHVNFTRNNDYRFFEELVAIDLQAALADIASGYDEEFEVLNVRTVTQYNKSGLPI